MLMPAPTPTVCAKRHNFFMAAVMGLGLAAGGLSGCQTPPSMTDSAQGVPPSTSTIRTSTINHPANKYPASSSAQQAEDYEVIDAVIDEQDFEPEDSADYPDGSNNFDHQRIAEDTTPSSSVQSTAETQETQTTAPVLEAPIEPTPAPRTPVQVREPVVIVRPPETRTTQQILLDQARQNSQNTARSNTSTQDGSTIPAFKRLMDTGVAQLRQGQVSAAQSTFTRAQRLAPQSSAVYFYLGQVALKQNQPLKAEAMARRGLVVAKTASQKQALWQVVLRAGQAQGNTRVINEAKAALSR